jgi:hypothetical protein
MSIRRKGKNKKEGQLIFSALFVDNTLIHHLRLCTNR